MRTYTTIDKSEWDRGPWDNEPDKLSWTDETTGLPCLIVRNSGFLCGYVGVPTSHPWHGVDYGDHLPVECSKHAAGDYCWTEGHEPDNTVDVHGGLTFAGACQHPDDPAVGICHIPEPGQPDDIWWFGFDTAHSGDLNPRTAGFYRERGLTIPDEVYRDVGYVTAEVASLAAQIAQVTA